MDITYLPDELLIQMCESWDTPTLINMSQAYSRVYQLCWKIRDQRREEFLQKEYEQSIDALAQQILFAINDKRFLGSIEFGKIFDNGANVEISISKGSNLMHILISQSIEPEDAKTLASIPWILPGTKFTNVGMKRIIKIYDLVKLRQLAKNLIDQGYE